MKSFCQNIPSVSGKDDVPSKLFVNLNKYISDRPTLVSVYSIATSQAFIDKYQNKLILDENGEPTVESILPLLNSKEITDSKFIIQQFNTQLNTNLENQQIYKVVKTAIDFNKSHTNYVATVVTDKNGKSTINVVNATDEIRYQAKQLEKTYDAFVKIDNFLKQKGLSIRWLDSGVMHNELGLMIPENLNTVSTGLMGVINIANNLEGFQILTEEFSHFIIENLKTTPIISRAEQLLRNNDSLLKEILGNDYDTVVQYYQNQNRPDLIAREALGRLMAQCINNNTQIENNLFERVKSFILNAINKIFKTNSSDNYILQKIQTDIQNVLNNVWNDDVINKETLDFFKQFGDKLAHATNNASSLEKQIENAENNITANLLKYLKVYHPMESEQDEKKEDKLDIPKEVSRQLYQLKHDLKEETMMKAITNLANDALRLLNANRDELYKIWNMKSFTFQQIRYKANALTQIKHLIDTYREPIIDYINLCEEIIKNSASTGSVMNSTNATELKDLLISVQGLINDTERVFKQANRNFLFYALKDYFEKDGIKFIDDKGQERVITLSMVIDTSLGDINALNRYVLAAANTDDLWVQLVDYFIQRQKERVRQIATQRDHKITAADKLLRQSGMRKTDWMYEFDANGIPTGRLISDYDYNRYYKELNSYKEHLNKLSLTDFEKKKMLDDWVINHTELFSIPYTYQTPNGETKQGTPREYRVPIYKSNAVSKLSKAQQEYYHKYMRQKWDLDRHLPEYLTAPFLAVQMTAGTATEVLLTSKQGLSNNIQNAIKTSLNNWFLLNDHDSFEYGSISSNLIEKFNAWKNSNVETIHTTTLRFDNTPYQTVPLYFVKPLDDLSRLSTDATTALREYSLMATNYQYMHQCADIIELIREQNNNRTIIDTTSPQNNALLETFEFNDETISKAAKIPTMASNIYNRVEDLINMEFYDKIKSQGFAITEKINSAKLADALIRFSSFSMLGYNLYSATNNVVAGKYQLFIEATGGEYFNHADLMKATANYWKMIKDFLPDVYLPYSTSKMSLLMETFNIGQHWKENIRNSRAYKSALHTVGSKLNSSFLLEMGEHYIQMLGALSYLSHYKLYKDPIQKDKNGNITNKDFVSLLDALTEHITKDKNGNIISTDLIINDKYKNFYTKDNKHLSLKPGSKDLAEMSLLIGKINQDMQGIYNNEDKAAAQAHAVGRLAFLYRRHLIPQFQKRFKSFGKGMGIYNFKSKQYEEGYYVTFARVIVALLLPAKSKYFSADMQDHLNTFKSRYELLMRDVLTTHQKANLKRFWAEMATFITLAIINGLLWGELDRDEQDPWLHRQLLYQLKRLQLEGTAYFPPSMVSNMLNILISPTAVISPLQKWISVIQAIPQKNTILKSGPYAGHSRLYANLMRALPIYPHLKSFITLNKNDGRFKIFNKGLLEQAMYDIVTEDEDEYYDYEF